MLLLSISRYTNNPTQDAHYTQRTLNWAKQTERGRSPLSWALLQPFRHWLSELEISDRNAARLLCFLIPARCPFERTFKFFGRTVLSIPPLCKLNPFYDELVALRFRCLCYLAEVVGEDISHFC